MIFNQVGGGGGGDPWDGSYVFLAKVSVMAEEGGSASGGGSFEQGDSCTVVATPDSTHTFSAWKDDNDQTVSTNATYTFTVSCDVTLHAVFAMKKITVTLSGSGNSSYCYATINGTKRTDAGSYQVELGSTITFGVYGRSSSYPGWVKVNNVSILNVTNQSTQTVTWDVPMDANAVTISFSYTSTSSQRRGQITVTKT